MVLLTPWGFAVRPGRQSDRTVFPWGALSAVASGSPLNGQRHIHKLAIKVMFPFWIEIEAAALWQLVTLVVACLATFTTTGLLRS